MNLRSSRTGEEEALARAANDAFRLMDLDGWVRWFKEHGARTPADTVMALDGDTLLGHATALRFTMRWRGRDLPFRGVAAVAVVPEARRRGVAGRVMAEIHRRMRARGEPLVLLHPFAVPFYEKLGYGIAEWPEIVRVPPAALPASPLRRNVRRLDVERDGAAMRAVYEQVRLGATGLFLRDEYWWTQRVVARVPERVAYVEDGRLTGYMLYDVPAKPEYPHQHVVVKELIATSTAARRGLLGFLEALGEQYVQVELTVATGTGATLAARPAHATADDLHLYHPACAVVSGVMARIIDVPRALALLGPGAARGRLGLDVTDPMHKRPLHFDVAVGARGVTAAPGERARERLALSISRLSQVFFAAARSEALLEQGHVEGSPAAARLLDAACAGPPLHLSRLNFF